jgi:hypothetical protein
MRESVPMPLRTSLTSAPTRSQICAISFMNEMRVASIALAAYLVISALAGSITRIGLPVRTNGPYRSSMILRARSSSTPITTRSGFMKSSIAAPSLRNSGLLTTANSPSVTAAIASRTLRFVWTGTVLLFTTTLKSLRFSPIDLATPST